MRDAGMNEINGLGPGVGVVGLQSCGIQGFGIRV